MSTGQGNIQLQQKRSASAPFTGATNGLTIIGTDIGIGGTLIQSSGIDISGNSLQIWDSFRNFSLIELDPLTNRYTFGIIDLATTIQNCWSFENDTAILYGGQLSEAIRIEQSSKTYTIGDLQNTLNGLIASIDNDTFFYNVRFAGSARRFLSIDVGNNNYSIGDVDNENNNTYFEIDDTQSIFRMYSFGFDYFQIDPTGGTYTMGDFNNQHAGACIRIDDTNEVAIIENTLGNMKIQMNGVNGITGSFAVGANTIEVNGGIITNIL